MKGNQLGIFIGMTDAEAEAPILWPSDANSQLTGKTLMLGSIEGRKRREWDRMRWWDGIIDSMDMLLLLLLSCFCRVRLCATTQTAAHQAPPSLGFSRQEYWSGCHFLLQLQHGWTWKCCTEVKKSDTKGHICMILLWNTHNRQICETESRLVVAGGWGRGECTVSA